jgi:heme-binding NEAT domain protein
MNVALNSAAAVKQFRSTMSMMEVVGYDLVQETRNVITHLSDGNNMSELDRYCLLVLNSKAVDGAFTTDGEIMANALKQYGLSLLKCMTQMKLYKPDGQLMYRFQSLVSSTIILEFIG